MKQYFLLILFLALAYPSFTQERISNFSSAINEQNHILYKNGDDTYLIVISRSDTISTYLIKNDTADLINQRYLIHAYFKNNIEIHGDWLLFDRYTTASAYNYKNQSFHEFKTKVEYSDIVSDFIDFKKQNYDYLLLTDQDSDIRYNYLYDREMILIDSSFIAENLLTITSKSYITKESSDSITSLKSFNIEDLALMHTENIPTSTYHVLSDSSVISYNENSQEIITTDAQNGMVQGIFQIPIDQAFTSLSVIKNHILLTTIKQDNITNYIISKFDFSYFEIPDLMIDKDKIVSFGEKIIYKPESLSDSLYILSSEEKNVIKSDQSIEYIHVIEDKYILTNTIDSLVIYNGDLQQTSTHELIIPLNYSVQLTSFLTEDGFMINFDSNLEELYDLYEYENHDQSLIKSDIISTDFVGLNFYSELYKTTDRIFLSNQTGIYNIIEDSVYLVSADESRHHFTSGINIRPKDVLYTSVTENKIEFYQYKGGEKSYLASISRLSKVDSSLVDVRSFSLGETNLLIEKKEHGVRFLQVINVETGETTEIENFTNFHNAKPIFKNGFHYFIGSGKILIFDNDGKRISPNFNENIGLNNDIYFFEGQIFIAQNGGLYSVVGLDKNFELTLPSTQSGSWHFRKFYDTITLSSGNTKYILKNGAWKEDNTFASYYNRKLNHNYILSTPPYFFEAQEFKLYNIDESEYLELPNEISSQIFCGVMMVDSVLHLITKSIETSIVTITIYKYISSSKISIIDEFDTHVYANHEDFVSIGGEAIFFNYNEIFSIDENQTLSKFENIISDNINNQIKKLDQDIYFLAYTKQFGKQVYKFTIDSPNDLTKLKNFPSFDIYPNPTTDKINVTGLQFSFTITNAEGKIVKTGKNKHSKDIDVMGLPQGIYFLSLYNERNEIIGTKSFYKN